MHASLVESYSFLKGEPDLMQLYQQRFVEALQLLKGHAEGRMTRDEYRDGTIEVKPG